VLKKLDQRLDALGVPHVGASDICHRARLEQPDAPLFFPDDTHPTPRLQDLPARDLARIVRLPASARAGRAVHRRPPRLCAA